MLALSDQPISVSQVAANYPLAEIGRGVPIMINSGQPETVTLLPATFVGKNDLGEIILTKENSHITPLPPQYGGTGYDAEEELQDGLLYVSTTANQSLQISEAFLFNQGNVGIFPSPKTQMNGQAGFTIKAGFANSLCSLFTGTFFTFRPYLTSINLGTLPSPGWVNPGPNPPGAPIQYTTAQAPIPSGCGVIAWNQFISPSFPIQCGGYTVGQNGAAGSITLIYCNGAQNEQNNLWTAPTGNFWVLLFPA